LRRENETPGDAAGRIEVKNTDGYARAVF